MNSNAKEIINIPKGVNEGMNLRVARKGHYSTGGQNGDLFVKVKIKPHAYFKRENFDIHTTYYINVSQAVLGAKVQVHTLNGEVTVTVDPGTNDGDVKKLLNYGITKLPPNQTQKGHHYIKFKIAIPNKLNETQRIIYEELSKVEGSVKNFTEEN